MYGYESFDTGLVLPGRPEPSIYFLFGIHLVIYGSTLIYSPIITGITVREI